MKIAQLIEYNIKNIFLEKLYTKCGGEASLRVFYKNLKFSICLDQQSEMLQSLLLLYVQVNVYQNISKLRCLPLVLTLYKAFFKKTKAVLELVSLSHFLHDFTLYFTLYFIN